ncbi:ion transporter [Vreelandella utahensis]|uniref:ion transporter n=1 Tax=Vreelandella halophila TaxID=86177 RepID=UPI000984362F|nr:ion transporter [Halomonas utahensis]
MRARLYEHIESSSWPGRGLSPFNMVVCVLILLSVMVAVLETEPLLRHGHAVLFQTLEATFFILFSIEYGLRVWVAGENPRYRGLTGRLRYMVSFWALIDLIALVPFLLSLGDVNAFLLRLMRVVRLLRVARLGRFSQAIEALGKALYQRRQELLLSGGAAFMLLLFSAAMLYVFEAERQPEAFGSIPRALWWSVATLTTVGYGDVTPVTVLGRIFAGITAFAGIGLVALPAGILAAAFSDVFQDEKKREFSEE